VTLQWDGIAETVEDGIVTKNGNHTKLGVLVPCTGFDTVETRRGNFGVVVILS
jgi:hypothetical protein